MRKTELKIEETPVTIITCDLCHKESKYRYSGIKECKVCKKDVCFDCSVHIDIECSLLEPYFDSDYPEYICKHCWEKGKEIRKKIMIVRDKAGDKECELWEQWGKIISKSPNVRN